MCQYTFTGVCPTFAGSPASRAPTSLVCRPLPCPVAPAHDWVGFWGLRAQNGKNRKTPQKLRNAVSICQKAQFSGQFPPKNAKFTPVAAVCLTITLGNGSVHQQCDAPNLSRLVQHTARGRCLGQANTLAKAGWSQMKGAIYGNHQNISGRNRLSRMRTHGNCPRLSARDSRHWHGNKLGPDSLWL